MRSRLFLRSALLVAVGFCGLTVSAFASGPFQFYSVTPCRVVDTRRPNGLNGGPALQNMANRDFPITGLCGVPPTAAAVTFNVTIATPTNPGYLILYPAATPQPLVSTINWAAGEVALANGAIVPITSGSSNLTVYSELYGGGTVQLILDVTGYFQ